MPETVPLRRLAGTLTRQFYPGFYQAQIGHCGTKVQRVFREVFCQRVNQRDTAAGQSHGAQFLPHAAHAMGAFAETAFVEHVAVSMLCKGFKAEFVYEIPKGGLHVGPEP